MTISEAFLPEFDHEIENTRRVLERVPDDKLGWRPHPKSGTFAWLGGHVANLPIWAKMTMESESFDYAPPGGSQTPPPAEPKTRKELLESLEKNAQAARTEITKADDDAMLKPWTLLKGGQTLFTMPRIGVLRGMILNHLIHHRGELCVYLRLNDIPVPGLYGPSADELNA